MIGNPCRKKELQASSFVPKPKKWYSIMRTGASCQLDDRLSGGGVRSSGFDYETVSSSVAKFLKGQAERIRRHSATSIIQIGKALIEAKRHLSHGGFLRWVECEVGIPARTAQAYMRVANWTSDKGATVAHLSPSALHLLSAAGVPEDFVSDVLSRAEAGEQIAPAVMREELKAFRLSKPERCQTKMCAKAASNTSQKWTSALQESAARGVFVELVNILVQGLTAADFDRVREIVTSDAVLSDPMLAHNLERAFCEATKDCMALV